MVGDGGDSELEGDSVAVGLGEGEGAGSSVGDGDGDADGAGDGLGSSVTEGVADGPVRRGEGEGSFGVLRPAGAGELVAHGTTPPGDAAGPGAGLSEG